MHQPSVMRRLRARQPRRARFLPVWVRPLGAGTRRSTSAARRHYVTQRLQTWSALAIRLLPDVLLLSLNQARGSGEATAWCVRAVTSFCVMGVLAIGGWAVENPRETVRALFAGRVVLVEYGRPSLHGRDVLNLIEPGQLWRLGADAPTTIESPRALDFGGVRVPKGKHILIVRYIKPGLWSLVVSAAPAIDYAPSARIAEVLLRFEKTQTPVQQLAIRLSNTKGKGGIEIAWGAYRLSARFIPAR